MTDRLEQILGAAGAFAYIRATDIVQEAGTLCARYSLTSPPESVRQLCQAVRIDGFPPRYNIAPSEPVLIARRDLRGENCELALVRWGFIPSWVKDPREFAMLINARAETAAEKPSFRGAMRHRRCLVLASGFYEWTGGRGRKQPHLIRLKDRELFAFAGLWESWLGADGSEIETMAILTTAANGDMARIHDRMPVILDIQDHERWLDCSSGSTDGILDLLKPLPDGCMTITAVNPKLNNPRAEGPELQEPLTATLL
jgi:putative SOS response-associated peptidase YedK